MKIVPPKQNGYNCGYVAVCHAINYFGLKTPARALKALATEIDSWQGFILTENSLQLLVNCLPTLEMTLIVNPEPVAGWEISNQITPIYTTGQSQHVVVSEASIICYKTPLESSLKYGYHVEFKLDHFTHTNTIDWWLLLHQPGATRA